MVTKTTPPELSRGTLQPPTAPTRSPPPSALPFLLLDGAIVAAAIVVSLWVRGLDVLAPLWQAVGAPLRPGLESWSDRYTALLVFQLTSIPVLLWATGQYRLLHDPGGAWSYNRVVLSIAASFAALLALLFTLAVPDLPRTVIVLDFFLVLAGASAWRQTWRRRVRRRHLHGRDLRNVVLVGSGRLQQLVAREFVAEPMHGRRVVGFLTNEPDRPLDRIPAEWTDRDDLHVSRDALLVTPAVVASMTDRPGHILAPIATLAKQDVADALDGLLVEEVYIGPDVPADTVRDVLALAQDRGLGVHLIPEHYPEFGIRPQAWSAGAYTFLDVHQRPFSRLGWVAKRSLDISGAIAGLIIGAPIILLTALAIKIETPRLPVFYPGTRVGLKGRMFQMAKFTTMVANAQEIEAKMEVENQREGPWFKLPAADDPRLTRVGRVIRKFSINEIPQFWNILRGDMSLVGPRPPTPPEVATYVDYDFRYYRCLDVKPGLTGLWQVTCKNDPSFDKRIDLDLEYVYNWNIWLDLKILLKTVGVVLRDHEE